MSNSIAVSPFTMASALGAADFFLGGPDWQADPTNPEQARWLETFRHFSNIAQEMPEVDRNATTVVADHVAWLKAKGWAAQVTQGSPGDIFLAATINIVAKWKEAGLAYKDRDGVDRVLLKKGITVSRRSGSHPVVMVSTQNEGFTFLFKQLENAPADRAALAALALDASMRHPFEQAHLDFPMVDLRVRDDAKYMVGLRSGPNVVSQAAEQFRLELNETGGRASAAAEVAVSRGMSTGPSTVYIEGPFMVVVIRDFVTKDSDRIAFAAYVDKDAWRKPADGRI